MDIPWCGRTFALVVERGLDGLGVVPILVEILVLNLVPAAAGEQVLDRREVRAELPQRLRGQRQKRCRVTSLSKRANEGPSYAV